ncbi:type II toxin-antitoxin system HicB family antitoxin [Lactobacillus sp. ESL0791]|uniref:type II toxin-antitoxin system HicB family antitoxin n=1 Tax=Lactobacillus sp. ESL0791 TaxID=2983234 RepID=UPI0023F6F46B|nr:type II toxin-antitoxin system HicB family antitoxin [Lactobacillus sp. ESL0791]MDF7638452.1 type II toxin-antitoxin system HicB family antitoxin [Lactobacillus sp. ESL0791]
MKYLYFAIFTLNKAGQYEVSFPDFAPEVATYGNNLSEALAAAKQALTGVLLVKEDYRETIPTASTQTEIHYDKGELLIPIEVNTELAREKEENKLVKKTLTIPSYLDKLGKSKGINFSQTLTAALKEKLI